MDWNDRAWIKAAGYSRRRNVGSLFLIVVASPFLWYWFHREFYSTRFRWATFMLITGTAVTTAWMELGMRCRCCTIPVLVYRFLESPSDRRKHALFDPTRCPYCGDDGTGKTGDINHVDLVGEKRRVIRSVRNIALVCCLALGILVLAALTYFLVLAYRHGTL